MAGVSKEVLSEADHECNIVKLLPYQHQVGGHNCVLLYDEKTICKPLDEQEHRVYSKIPDGLKEFIPKIKGVVKVHYERIGDDVFCFAIPLDCSYCKDIKRLRNYLIATDALNERSLDGSKDASVRSTSRSDRSYHDAFWNNMLKEKLVRRWLKNAKQKELEKFLLLENISKRFKYPCTIDLKMGTRVFGDAASREKREVKQKRANSSTSASLGVRLCGMQIYHPVTNKYIFTDKYKGREYSESDFKDCIKNFIFNGSMYRVELLKPCINKLKALHSQLENIECYRFYCSSLLLMYDGVHTRADREPDIEVRMIDFAHTTVKEDETNHHIGPDHGYILGVESLINLFTQINEELTQGTDTTA